MLQDARFAFRQLVKTPGFTLIAILTLALAIGANIAIFSAADAVLLHPLPYPHADQLVVVQENLPAHALSDIAPTPEDLAEFVRRQTCFSQIAGVINNDVTLTGDGSPEYADGARVSASLFPMLGVVPILGSLFTSEQEQPGKDAVAILSEPLWIRRFGADRSIIGKTIQIDRQTHRVIGVIRTTSVYRAKADVWRPLAFTPEQVAPGTRGPHYVEVLGRLKPGFSIDRAREEFGAIAREIFERYPNQTSLDRNFSIDVWPLAERQAGDLRTPLLVLIAAVGALMLIACANVSNLLLARGAVRRREIRIRAALGAGRGRVVRLLLTESLLLASSAGVTGAALAAYALHLFALYGPEDLIRGTQPSMNVWVMLFSIGLSIGTSALFGLAPALASSRVDLAESLKEVSRGSTARRRVLRESLVAFEIAASLILLIGAGLVARSFAHLAEENPGFRADNVLTATVALPPAQYRDAAQRIAFSRALLERARNLPGVRSAATVDVIPYRGGSGSAIQIPGNPDPPGQVVWQTRASPNFFGTLGIPILRGRDFLPSEEQAPGAAIIDENVARTFFPGLDPIGRRVTLPLAGATFPIAGATFPIVGIVGAVKSNNPAAPPPPRIYYLGPQSVWPPVGVVLKTQGDPMALAGAIRREIAALDPDLPADTSSMEQILAQSLTRQRFAVSLMSVFAILAALLAAIGIYGVLAYLADQRRNEFGIRMALGARPGDVLALVIRQGAIPLAVGLAAGLAGALALTRLIATLLYHVSPADPLVFAVVACGLTIAALIAMIIPARRATRIDPVEALRQE
jgi:putative ABC transport system permease protein